MFKISLDLNNQINENTKRRDILYILRLLMVFLKNKLMHKQSKQQ